ncbi:MAG TPA: hypothetical protein VGJ04_07755 [Pirellulales bacterium]
MNDFYHSHVEENEVLDFEKQLRKLSPVQPTINRDALFYQVGYAAGRSAGISLRRLNQYIWHRVNGTANVVNAPAGGSAVRRVFVALAIGLGLIVVFAKSHYFRPPSDRAEILNGLRDEINDNYGIMTNGTPRINCGPCARFAIAFLEQWNARFCAKVNIVCIMSSDGTECGHVVLSLPNGSYFDGGNGVLSKQKLLGLYLHCSMNEMHDFNRELLDQRVGGLNHDHYPQCPNYSDRLTAMLIEKHLALLPSDIDQHSIDGNR